MYRTCCALVLVTAISAQPRGGNSTNIPLDEAVPVLLGVEPGDMGLGFANEIVTRLSNATDNETSNATHVDEPIRRGALFVSPVPIPKPPEVHMPEVPQYVNDAFQKCCEKIGLNALCKELLCIYENCKS